MKIRRRITLQLTPLLDLLLVVIFAQYIQLQDRASEQVAMANRGAETRIATIEAECALAEKHRGDAEVRRHQAMEELAGREETLKEARDEIAAMRERIREAELTREEERREQDEKLLRIGALAAELFNLDAGLFEEAIRAAPLEEMRTLKKEFEDLRGKSPEAVIRHLREIDEIKKRCDLWEVHIAVEGRTNFRLPGVEQPGSFWAASADDFVLKARGLIARIAEPKSLVVILLSYSDATWGARKPVEEGIEQLKEWLRKEYAGKSFHVANLGYTVSMP